MRYFETWLDNDLWTSCGQTMMYPVGFGWGKYCTCLCPRCWPSSASCEDGEAADNAILLTKVYQGCPFPPQKGKGAKENGGPFYSVKEMLRQGWLATAGCQGFEGSIFGHLWSMVRWISLWELEFLGILQNLAPSSHHFHLCWGEIATCDIGIFAYYDASPRLRWY